MPLKVNPENWEFCRLELQKKPWSNFRIAELASEIGIPQNIPGSKQPLNHYLSKGIEELKSLPEFSNKRNFNKFFKIIKLFNKQDSDWADLTAIDDFASFGMPPNKTHAKDDIPSDAKSAEIGSSKEDKTQIPTEESSTDDAQKIVTPIEKSSSGKEPIKETSPKDTPTKITPVRRISLKKRSTEKPTEKQARIKEKTVEETPPKLEPKEEETRNIVPDHFPIHLLNINANVLNYLLDNKVSTFYKIQEFFLSTPSPKEPFLSDLSKDTLDEINRFKKIIFMARTSDMRALIDGRIFRVKNAIESICNNVKKHQKPYVLAALDDKENEIVGNSPKIISLIKKVKTRFFLEMTAVLLFHKSQNKDMPENELMRLFYEAMDHIKDKDNQELATLAMKKIQPPKEKKS